MVTFRLYKKSDFENCIRLFEQNSPEFFAPNEKTEYSEYLNRAPKNYHLGFNKAELVAAFGFKIDKNEGRISWIMVSPLVHGSGVGSEIMKRIFYEANCKQVEIIHISASHKSEPFFSKFGAKEVKRIADGWGPEMHRVDMVLNLNSAKKY